jgi:ribonuclease E
MSDVLESGATGAAPEPEPSEPSTPSEADAAGGQGANKRRRRGTRGGRGRNRTRVAAAAGDADEDDVQPELPDRPIEGKVQSPEVAERVLVRRPKIGDTRPAPEPVPTPPSKSGRPASASPAGRKRRRNAPAGTGRSGGARTPGRAVVTPSMVVAPVELDEETLERRRGRERKGRPVGRYMMCVHVAPGLTQIAVLEGRNLIEHYVSRPSDDVTQIHGNVYLGRVQNVLPGMEAAFVDIGTPKNAVLYRGDVQYEAEDIVERSERPRIEQMLKARQMILCQVTKNPIGAKGARLTQEVSLPGRFVVLIPNSRTYGISKRLPDDERKRLRSILDKIKPAEHGVIVRTAAENVVEEELSNDVRRLLAQWADIEAAAKKVNTPTLLYREPDMALRVIREEFNKEYRGVVLDHQGMYDEVKDYVSSIMPALSDRVDYYDAEAEGLPLFERFHVHEQLHKALDRKVWLPSGGSLIIEHTEALTVIDVNTGKNVGTSNLEATVFHNNLEAADEIARQLRLRDIGGIIVIDFIDMELRENRQAVVSAFRDALARDKTRTQVFDISELGLVEMTRKRIGEGLLTSFAEACPMCEGRGVVVDHSVIE